MERDKLGSWLPNQVVAPFAPCLNCRINGDVTPNEEGLILECPFTNKVAGIVASKEFTNAEKARLVAEARQYAKDNNSGCPQIGFSPFIREDVF